MTDDEFIKYLEQAVDEYDKNERFISNVRLDKLSLDLINRQKVEIDNLRADLKRVFAERDARICTSNFIKSEAIKEFAERLKNEINIRTTYSREQDKNVMRMIDNLVKEMVGEDNTE